MAISYLKKRTDLDTQKKRNCFYLTKVVMTENHNEVEVGKHQRGDIANDK